ncbi:MAG: glycosyltransferase family 39 protein, partial [Thermoanaerobaculia bacterium]|nr:glycosyltransferase family 39 protein [Thermoanaerobaculia bacterium]
MSREGLRRLGRLELFLGLASVGLLIRLLYFTEHLSSPFFGVAILDEAFYDAVARALLAWEEVTAIDPGFRPLLYPAFLAVAYGIGGTWDVVTAVGLQHLLGIGAGLLVAWIAVRLSGSRRAGFGAGLLYLLAGPPLYFEGERLITTLFTFLMVGVLAALVRAEKRPENPGRWILAGLVAALAAMARPNALVVLPVLLGVGV